MAQDKRVVRTKRAISQALFELLGEKEFDKISVTELTKRANVDRKTFYLHYRTTGDILEEFYADHMARLQEIMENADGSKGDARAALDSLGKLVGENLGFHRHLARGPACGFFRERLGEAFEKRIYNSLVEEAPERAAEMEVYAAFFAHGIMEVYLEWLQGKIHADPETVTMLLERVIPKGSAFRLNREGER